MRHTRKIRKVHLENWESSFGRSENLGKFIWKMRKELGRLESLVGKLGKNCIVRKVRAQY